MGMQSREAYFDNAKWILIIFVVFGHVIESIQEDIPLLYSLYTTIYLFHMAGFIMISGYFAKNFHQPGYLTKIAKKTLLPYLIFQMGYALFYTISGMVRGVDTSSDLNPLSPHFTLWFLLSLFCWNLMLYLFAKFRWWIVLVALGIGLAAGFVDVSKLFSFSRTFVFFPFFLAGYFLNPTFFRQLRAFKWRIPACCFLTSLLLIFYVYSPENNMHWLEGAYSYADLDVKVVYGALIRLIQYMLMFLSVFSVLSLIPDKHFKITVLGTRTLYIYLLHGIIILTARRLIPEHVYKTLSFNVLLPTMFALALVFFLGSRRINELTRPLVEWGTKRKEKATYHSPKA